MLNTLRRGQKSPSEVDSSDSGSDLGLEPETDRFGFLLTDGSTEGNRKAGPSPVLVRQREAKWIDILDQWDRLLLKKTRKIKLQCHKGIPASLRARCWSLLSAATDRKTQHKDLYKPALKHWEDVIVRDLDRQFPFHEMFVAKDGYGQQSLFQMLKAYTKLKPEEGYCQAQGPVAAVLLMNMPAEEAFWCLVQICEQYLPGYYSPLLEGVLFDAAILMWVLKRACPAAHKHLQHHGVEPLMFATDWLMCLFTRHLPFNTLLRVWDLFFCYGIRVLLQVAVVLVQRVLGREDQRKECCGQMETLQRLRGIRDEIKDEEDDFVDEVLSVSLSAKDLQRQTEKELQRWQTERPSSTFDPRDRCLGYHMAWLRSRQSKEQYERTEKEKCSLSVSLFRSASTLSLSTSKWPKGVKANSREPKRSAKVTRHLSMGAKEDWQSWANVNVKKVQNIQGSGFVFKEKKTQSEPRTEHKNQQNELEESKNQPIQSVSQKTEQMEKKELSTSAADLSDQEEDAKTNYPQNEKQSIQNPVNNTEEDKLNKDCAAEKKQTFDSIKQLCTEAVCDRVDHEKNIGESQQQNKGTDKHLEKLAFAGKFHSTESLPGTKIKKSHTQVQGEMNEVAAQGLIDYQIMNSNDSLPKQMEKTKAETFRQRCINDSQARRQDITVKLKFSGGIEDKTIDFQSSPEMEEATYFRISSQMQQSLSLESAGLSTEADTSDNINKCTYKRETQSNVYSSDKELQRRKTYSEIQPLEDAFMNSKPEFSFRSSGDFRVRRSSSSRGSRSARILSEELFTSPQLHSLGHAEKNETVRMSSATETEVATDKEEQPKRFGLFRRQRGENKNKNKPKIQLPKILIQDFSDERNIRQVTEVECKLTSRERRRQLREQRRREKEHERAKNKDLEKECRRDQAKSTSVHTESIKDKLQLRDAGETSYSDVYF